MVYLQHVSCLGNSNHTGAGRALLPYLDAIPLSKCARNCTLPSINETKWPGILAIVLFIVGIQTKDMIWLPLSIRPALCAVLFMFVGQKAREASLFDKGALPPALWICALMTWLYCGAFYGQLYMVSNTYQHGAIDVIGGICGAAILIKLSGLTSERLPAATPPSPGSGGTRLRYSAYTSSCSMLSRGAFFLLGATRIRLRSGRSCWRLMSWARAY